MITDLVIEIVRDIKSKSDDIISNDEIIECVDNIYHCKTINVEQSNIINNTFISKGKGDTTNE